ncbi:hypothetical protein [Nocardiopsis suaedae]|uniref:Uncharacterized protein n=1 Tax=Nocardiopsis suaedae TaxID=3018444 RepID=A0ABT4TM27_9ACTN|nr:hypothetical protein [Nocardiopsis suaedae]MDA2805725.1 hypothetical protein [Nocardiopsis suaedae]
MTGEPLYTLVNGEPMLSHRAVALLTGLPTDVVKAEWDRQAATATMTWPREWAKRGTRIRKEVSAALGYEPSMKEAIDYLAAKADR